MILDHLNLAGNQIKTIGNSLKANISIEKLNLSGNEISDLEDVLNLCNLPKLKHLTLNGPDYIANPIFQYTNYFLFILFHFVNLKSLDTFDVNSSYLRDVVLNIVTKKKLFYSMKKETLYRSCEFKKLQLRRSHKESLLTYEATLRSLNSLLRMIEQRLSLSSNETLDFGDACLSNRDYFEENLDKIRARCNELEDFCDCLQNDLEFYINKTEAEKAELIDLHQMELTSCGNFKIEISGDKSWALLCHDLLNSRFCNYEIDSFQPAKIQTHRIIKIKNIHADRTYNKAIKDLKGELPQDIGDNLSQDYLFWFLDGNDDSGTLVDLLTYFYNNSTDAIKCTNSLFFGDIRRNSADSKLSSVRYGRVVVVKAFVGQSKEEKTVRVLSNSGFDSFFIPLRNCANSNVCACAEYKYEWHFRGSALLVPEYVVDFEYLRREELSTSRLYDTFHELMSEVKSRPENVVDNDFHDVKKQIELESLNKRLVPFLREIGSSNMKSKITSLNLTDCQLKSVPEIGCLENLTSLVMPFNNLVNLKDISNKKLRTLDISYNSVQTLDEMHDLLNLKVFYLQHNFLMKTREEISFLHNHATNVAELNVKYNFFQKPETVKLRIIGRLKCLKVLNDREVTEAELKTALDLVFRSRITETAIIECGRIDTIKPRTLIMDDVATVLLRYSDNKLASPVNDFSKFLRITSLNLNNQNISKISNIDRLENLKYLSLTNNYISKIEGLDHCGHLEELILDNNTITKIENLSRLQKLKKISLNVNYINSVGHLRTLPSLQVVSVHTNKLVSLAGLECCEGLNELYVANNFISDSSEITALKGLINLIILDLFNNPIVGNSKNYRLNVVFHLKSLKALDGLCIDNSEINQSKEVLGGRLNLDFIREKNGSDNFADIVELDLSNCFIKSVDLTPIDKLKSVRSLNLENNNLTSFSGLVQLSGLKVLCLNSNLIESIVPRNSLKTGIQPISKGEPDRKVHLNCLEVLHLGYNNIKSLSLLGLHDIPSLKALFLQGNDISTIEGLECLSNLRELVLDQNRIKSIGELSLASNINLREIHLEENRLKKVTNIFHLGFLKRLYIGNNKIAELQDLDLFGSLEGLLDVSVVGNPVCRKNLHRQYLVHLVPSLLMVDGLEVTEEERFKADSSSLEEGDVGTSLPGIVVHNKYQNLKQNSIFSGGQTETGKPDLLKGDGFKKRPTAVNPYGLVNKAGGIQLVANTKAVYFYDPIGHNDGIPRLYLNKKK